MSQTSSQVLADSRLDSSERVSVPCCSASPIRAVDRDFAGIGQTSHVCTTSTTSEPIQGSLMFTPSDSLASSRALQPAAETTHPTYGPKGCEWSERADRIGSLLKMSLVSDMTELTGCAVILSSKATPSGRSISILRYQRDSVADIGSSGWPTPTETANHDSPSMRKWPAYARYQDATKRTTPRLWEWMMGFAAGWTACTCSETRSRRRSPSSSLEQL
jgi:hypothetical protein